MSKRPRFAALLAATLVVAASACAPDAPVRPPSELSAAALRSATYPNTFVEEGTVRLDEGKYEDPARRVVVFMLPEYAVGDLDGDSVPDAAVLLATNTGGSGTFHDLVAVLNLGGEPDAVTSFLLGDRVPAERIRIVDGTIEVDLTMHGPGDPMCCPTMEVTRRFRYGSGALQEIDPPSDAPEYLP
jgi:hypothetical protein